MTKNFLDQIKKTIVFIGHINPEGKEQILATGFLTNIDEVYHLITAKHVIFKLDKHGNIIDKRENLYSFLNTKEGGMVAIPFKKIESDGLLWVYHSEPKIDMTLIPFPIAPEYDIKTIPKEFFLNIGNVFETFDVFYLSFQPGLTIPSKDKQIKPIVRKGMISRVNMDKTFYIDGFAFPGNSGSPVFLKPQAIRFSEEGLKIGGDPLGGKFIGLIGGYLPYKDRARSDQTGEIRVIFEENTGLSIVWSVDYLQEIISSDQFLQQITKIKQGRKLNSATKTY